ncbi:hypothetical protein [Pseudoxanthomonas putridarboris]|uniref:Uncharacterized protein n=1 Tax=Pseudoxanthomonas putridarboris TaxID=752605 RepID=A0ABU9IX38_9GAMM
MRNTMGNVGHSAVIVQTHQDTEADITIIVHSHDEHLTRSLHEVCLQAVRHAVRSFDALPDAVHPVDLAG